MTNRQMLVSAVVLGFTAALVVWWLERFNRERLISDFHAQLEKLPTWKGQSADA